MKKLIIVLLSFLLFMLTACGNLSPTDTVHRYLKAVKAGDSEKIAEIYEGNATETALSDSDSELTRAIKEIINDFEYELSNEVIEAEKAYVDCKMTTYKIGYAVTDAFADYVKSLEGDAEADADELNGILVESVKNAPFEYEDTVTISLTKVEDKWVIDRFEEKGDFMNMYAGGLYSMFDSMSKLMGLE